MAERATILVCDDEELIRWSLNEHLTAEGYRVIEAEDGEECLKRVGDCSPDLVLSDLKMPRMGGLEMLRQLRSRGSEVPVIVLTAFGAVETAVEATRLGASDYLSKPFDLREISLAVDKVLIAERLRHEVRYLRGPSRRAYSRIIGRSQAMQKMFHTLQRLEEIDTPMVLVIGESGTGKDLIAHAIHEMGPRKTGPMMEIDCASLPEQLIESELFGHEKGAFTDAHTTKRGLFEVARGGTIFLDEIGEMSPTTQARLLRALENRRFKRVGGLVDIAMDASVIAATNRDLAVEVKAGRFREDLFFRLNVIRVEAPPLRQRREDIPLLVDHLIEKFNRDFRRTVQGISATALSLLQSYPWPGNVRELRNVIERAIILESDELIEETHLPPEIRYSTASRAGLVGTTFLLPEGGVDLEQVELSLVKQAMVRTESNQTAAAKLLGISRYALRYRLEKYGMLPSQMEK
ncbi:MAG: two-component system response regulator AtoC [Myxococcota bacterium]|jgi:two-component system response regulator AtoC